MLRHLFFLAVFLTGCASNSPTPPPTTTYSPAEPNEWARRLEEVRNDSESVWTMQNIRQYRMIVDRYHTALDCRQEIVHQDHVSTLVEDTCNDGVVRDINYLFDHVETRITHYAANPTCGPNGCDCDGPINIEVDYHIRYGYPMIIREHVFPEYRDRTQDIPGQLHTCTAMGFAGERLYLTAFIPDGS
jgi:hypothetical protein